MTQPPTADRHELVRRANIEAIFQAISETAPVTRNQLVELTGLSRPTVQTLVSALVEHGLIRVAPAPARRRAAGRVATRFEANPKAGFVVGIDVGGTKSHAALADLAGEIIVEEEAVTTQDGAEAVVAQWTELVQRIAATAGVGIDEIGAVSLGTPGVRNNDGTIRMADNVPGLDRMDVPGALGDRLRVPVMWENDVNAAALGELRSGVAQGLRSFVLLSVGTGLGMGIVVNGKIVRGWRGGAGEVAYLPIGVDPASPAAARRGAFELAAAGSGVVDIHRRVVTEGTPSALRGEAASARQIYDAAAAGDPAAQLTVQLHAELLAHGVMAVAAILDPELVVVGGGIGSNAILLDPLRAATRRLVPWPVRLETSGLGARAGVIGAVHRGLSATPRLRSDRVSSRLARRAVMS